jgi:hypothetical protein
MKSRSYFGRVYCLLVVFTFLLSAPATAAVFHVTTAGEFTTALSTAKTNGEDDTIYLAAGTYQGHFTLNTTDAMSLVIKAESGLSAPNVILDGGSSGTVLKIEGSASGGTVSLEDLTLQNGTQSGIYVELKDKRVHILLNRLIIQNNSNEYRGGGIYLRTIGNATIDMEIWNSIIRNNQTQGYSGGGQGRGGAIWAYSYAGSSLINLLVVNSLIYRNEANWSSGGIEIASSEVGDNNVTRGKIINSTITGNVSNMHGTGSERGGGVWVNAYSGNGSVATLDLYNTIVYGNTSVGGSGAGQDLYVTKSAPGSAVVNAYSSNINDVAGDMSLYHPTNVINNNPLFTDPANDNYHLTADSPCINAGTADVPSPPGLPETDFEENQRVVGPLPDIGAYEFGGLNIKPHQGTIGTIVDVMGTGFGTRRGKVSVGTAALRIIQWAADWIQASLTKALPAGVYDVKIEARGIETQILEGGFESMEPVIDSVEPASGSINDEITLQGQFFGTKRGKITLGGKNCRILSWTMNPTTNESEIHFVVPRGLNSGTHELNITNGVGSDSVDFSVE